MVEIAELIKGMKFCAAAVKKTKHWACNMIFIRPCEIFVWDGEQGARYPIETGVEITVHFDPLFNKLKDLRDTEVEVGFEVKDSMLWINTLLSDYQIDEAFTEFGKLPEMDRKYNIEMTNLSLLPEILKVATATLTPPGWLEAAVIFCRKAIVASDGAGVFFAEDRGLYYWKQTGGKDAVWVSWRLCKLMARLDPPVSMKIGTQSIFVQWANGAEIVTSVIRSDAISDKMSEVCINFNPATTPIKLDPQMSKLLLKFPAQAETWPLSTGIFCKDGGRFFGMEIAGNRLWSDGTTDETNDAPQFYLDTDRLQKFLRFAQAFDAEDIRTMRSDREGRNQIRFYGNDPAPYTMALAIQR